MIQQFKKFNQSFANTDFQIFTKKVGVLPRLQEYPNTEEFDLSIPLLRMIYCRVNPWPEAKE